ncbi:hypothetical protein ACQCVB_17300 [Fictibacillus phosphorivorans]
MSFIKIFIGNKKETDTNCCSVQIVEVNDNEETACCETETNKEQHNCC